MSDGCNIAMENIFIVQEPCVEARSMASTEEALDISDIDKREKHDNDLSSPKIIGSGWRGKKISNGDYTKFGASQGFDKPYDYGIGDRGGHNDEDPAKEQKKRNGDGDDGEDGERGGRKKGERDAQEENGESVLEKHFSLLNNLENKLAGLEVVHEYDSLFKTELKEELRRQLKAKNAIETEFYFDPAGRSRKVAEEQMLQERWMREWFDRREEMRVASMDVKSHQLGKAKLNYQERNLPYDDGKRVHSWIWMQRIVTEIDGEWCGLDRKYEERPSPQAKLAIVYQKCFPWSAKRSERCVVWENDLLAQLLPRFKITLGLPRPKSPDGTRPYGYRQHIAGICLDWEGDITHWKRSVKKDGSNTGPAKVLFESFVNISAADVLAHDQVS
ncbi:hypothetical protein HYFRA_00009033 [Hymenoscyphus fraxineus]|uniref:Uncharacterized protein n=1 Tax=Hymenoscyphus fraxineus TaxID=746836 RepID=A0A9N9KTS8_9HELO|nr:hypothetical protein HYFRA_00009033 [Hymenoscyphus fraxineus]